MYPPTPSVNMALVVGLVAGYVEACRSALNNMYLVFSSWAEIGNSIMSNQSCISYL